MNKNPIPAMISQQNQNLQLNDLAKVLGQLNEVVTEVSATAKEIDLHEDEVRPPVKVAKLHEDAIIPAQAHPGDAGFDIYSNIRIDVPPGQSMLVGTGLAMEIPEGWCGQINPRSGLASGKRVVVGARIIDSGYRGEIKINLINHGDTTLEVKPGDRVAQILFIPVLQKLEEIDKSELTITERNAGGFGSTGV